VKREKKKEKEQTRFWEIGDYTNLIFDAMKTGILNSVT